VDSVYLPVLVGTDLIVYSLSRTRVACLPPFFFFHKAAAEADAVATRRELESARASAASAADAAASALQRDVLGMVRSLGLPTHSSSQRQQQHVQFQQLSLQQHHEPPQQSQQHSAAALKDPSAAATTLVSVATLIAVELHAAVRGRLAAGLPLTAKPLPTLAGAAAAGAASLTGAAGDDYDGDGGGDGGGDGDGDDGDDDGWATEAALRSAFRLLSAASPPPPARSQHQRPSRDAGFGCFGRAAEAAEVATRPFPFPPLPGDLGTHLHRLGLGSLG